MNIKPCPHKGICKHPADKAEQNECKIRIEFCLTEQILNETQEHSYNARTDGILQAPPKESRETGSDHRPVEHRGLEGNRVHRIDLSDTRLDLIGCHGACTDFTGELIQRLETLKVKVLPRHTPHLCKHSNICSAQCHDNAGCNDHHIHMTNTVRTAYKVDRPLHSADFSACHEHTLTNVNRTLKDVVDVDSCSFIRHNEHSYSMTQPSCHLLQKKYCIFSPKIKAADCSAA